MLSNWPEDKNYEVKKSIKIYKSLRTQESQAGKGREFRLSPIPNAWLNYVIYMG